MNKNFFHNPIEVQINDQLIFVGHGDGLGPGDKGYKRMKKVFVHPVSKWFFRWLHPDLGVQLAQYLSVKNKLISGDEDAKYLGEDNEWLILYTKKKELEKHRDYYIFGHRHLPMVLPIMNNQTQYVNIGDWIQYFTYVTITSSGTLELKVYEG